MRWSNRTVESSITDRGTESGSWLAMTTLVAWWRISRMISTTWPMRSDSPGYRDVAYFLTQGDGPWGALGWTFDKVGNRLTETRDGNTDTYSYTPNPVAGHTALLDHITLAVGGTRDYAYDLPPLATVIVASRH